jgi:hypothetical protein
MKYHLMFTEACSIKIKSFHTEKEMMEFAGKFAISSKDNPDNFIDGMFYGQLGWIDESIEVSNG